VILFPKPKVACSSQAGTANKIKTLLDISLRLWHQLGTCREFGAWLSLLVRLIRVSDRNPEGGDAKRFHSRERGAEGGRQRVAIGKASFGGLTNGWAADAA
jgi:hypothetical protein